MKESIYNKVKKCNKCNGWKMKDVTSIEAHRWLEQVSKCKCNSLMRWLSE